MIKFFKTMFTKSAPEVISGKFKAGDTIISPEGRYYQIIDEEFTHGYYLYKYLGKDCGVIGYNEICKPQSWKYVDNNFKLRYVTKLERALK